MYLENGCVPHTSDNLSQLEKNNIHRYVNIANVVLLRKSGLTLDKTGDVVTELKVR